MTEASTRLDAAKIAAFLGAELRGDPDRLVAAPFSLEGAGPAHLAFLDRGREAPATIGAGTLIVADFLPDCASSQIRVDEPRAAFARIMQAFFEPVRPDPFISPAALISGAATIGDEAVIEEFVSVGMNVEIGARVRLHPHVVIGRDCEIGDDVEIHSQASIRPGTIIGDRVVIHDGSVIGSDGFGYVQSEGRHLKVPQLGRVVIEDDVEIGANVCIDRAALGETRVGRGTKIDNLVQIAHNVELGRHDILIAQVGISGSVKIGDGVMIGGQAGVVDHVEIGDGAMIGAGSGVDRDVQPGRAVSGRHAFDHEQNLRSAALYRRLPEMRRQLAALQKKLDELARRSPDRS